MVYLGELLVLNEFPHGSGETHHGRNLRKWMMMVLYVATLVRDGTWDEGIIM